MALAGLRNKIKDKIVGFEAIEFETIEGDKKGYNIICWSNAECLKYTVYIRDEKEVEEIKNITKEGRELNINALDYLNFMIFEYRITKDYSFFD